MSAMPIIIAPDARLSAISAEVESVNLEVRRLVDNMFETMYLTRGLGLAAVQVGAHKRIFVTAIPPCEDEIEDNLDSSFIKEGGPYCMINPQILEISDKQVLMPEGCLSIPYQRDYILRPQFLTISYLDYNGATKILKAKGWLARCIQHEIDHLNGKLFIEHLSKLKYDLAIKKAIKTKKRKNLPEWAEIEN